MRTNSRDNWYVADFETTTEETYLVEGLTRVWLYAICDSKANVINYGYTIDEFFAFLPSLKGSTIYFHNLKFDGTFIIDWLLRNGYEYKENLTGCKQGFTALISDMGVWYNIVIRLTKSVTIKICDSLKIIPTSVYDIAKGFDLPIQKLNIDYNENTIDEHTLEYVFNDVKIVAMALKQCKQNGMLKNTTASCAYSNYTDSKTQKFLLNAFPDLDTDFLIEWRKAYRGGRSQVNPLYAEQVLHNVYRYDINSMYPYIMHDLPLPYGKPIPIVKMGNYRFELYHLKMEFELLEGHMPTLLKKSMAVKLSDAYYIDTDGVEDIWISNIDLEVMRRHYNIYSMELVEGYGFITSTILFKDYIDFWYQIKNNTHGAAKIVAKRMLNSLYGKFGSDIMGAHKLISLGEEKVEFTNSEQEEMTKYYLPIAIAITSYGHRLLDDAITAVGYEYFVYCDTDSVHCLTQLPEYMIDANELGKFKLESVEIISKYVRSKTYVTLEENWTEYYNLSSRINITCAGMPLKAKSQVIADYGLSIFKAFAPGFVCGGKLMPKRVKGGTILHETTFEIK